MKKPLEKNTRSRKTSYVFLSLFIIFNLLILTESAIPGGLSSSQSDFFASIGAWIVNLFGGYQTPKSVLPDSIKLISDSSFLGEGQIAIGSSSRLSYEIHFPQADAFEREFSVDRLQGSNDDYELVINQGKINTKDLTITNSINIVGLKTGDFSFTVNCAGEISSTYSFSIVDLPAPSLSNFTLGDIPKNLSVGSGYQIPLTLVDPTGLALTRSQSIGKYKDDSVKAVDDYLRRLYDPSKLSFFTPDPDGLSIDKFGTIRALKTGSYQNCWYGDDSLRFDITVSSQPSGTTSLSSFSLSTSRSTLTMGDYDFDGYNSITQESTNYGSLVKASEFVGKNVNAPIIDDGVIFYLKEGDSLKAKVRQIDEHSCIVQGYRNLGNVVLIAESESDPTIKKEITLTSGEGVPQSFNVNFDGALYEGNKSFEIGTFIYGRASFTPQNIANKKISVISNSNPTVVEVGGDGTALISFKGLSIGSSTVTLGSVLDPSLTVNLSLEVTGKKVINSDNIDDWGSYIRKLLGHFLLFAFTAAFGFLFVFFFDDEKRNWKRLLTGTSLVGATGFVVAGFSELIQYFVPDRTASWADVGIDFGGVCLGIALTWLIGLIVCLIIKAVKKKKEETTKTKEP